MDRMIQPLERSDSYPFFPPSLPLTLPPVLLGLMYLGSGRSTSGISAIQNRMGIFMLEMLFLAFTVRFALPLFNGSQRFP